MKTAEGRLRFAVRFAGLDLREFRPGDWMNLREDLEAFLTAGGTLADRGGIIATPLKPPLPKDMSEDDLRSLHAQVHALLGGLADRQAVISRTAGPVGGTIDTFRIDVNYAFLPLFRATAGRGIVTASGATRDVTLLTLIHLLSNSDVSPIRRCPEDGRLFYRVRRQEYCSRTCVNRANKRTWRASQSKKKRKQRRPKKGASR